MEIAKILGSKHPGVLKIPEFLYIVCIKIPSRPVQYRRFLSSPLSGSARSGQYGRFPLLSPQNIETARMGIL
jgi:hypothetical protein